MSNEFQDKNRTQAKESMTNLLILSVLVLIAAVILLIRFGQLSIVKQVNQVDLTSYQQTTQNRSSITQAKRGSLFDRFGQPIAMDTTSYSMFAVVDGEWADGEQVQDKQKTASILSMYIDLDYDTILNILNTPDVDQVEFGAAGQDITPETKEEIEVHQLAGINFQGSASRFYVNDYFSSHLIGYVKPLPQEDKTQPAFQGELGIELAYDEVLSGENTITSSEDSQTEDAAIGEDVHLTLDTRLQNAAEDAVENTFNRFQPKNMGAYLVELETGKLLAASQRPSFNLNTKEGIEKLWANLMVESANEPGSTVKILTMASAIDQKVIQPHERFMSGEVEVYDRTVKDYNLIGWGEITFEEGLARSSNVAMVELVNRMGDEAWVEQLAHLGFGSSTQSSLPGEVAGNLDFDNPVSRIMSGFGQGFSATPLQLLQAFTTIGNQGEMLKIQYIDHIGEEENSQFENQSLGQKFSPEAADYVLDIMVDTVEESYGTAQSFKSNQVDIAAKTGTAQIADPNGEGYLTGANDYYHSVVAYFPAQNPKYMLYLFLKQPEENHGMIGSQMLAETFHPIINAVMLNQ